MSLKPYPVYKDSGVNWLGQLPDDWEVRPSKSVFGLRNRPEVEGDIHLTPSQSLGVLPQSEYMRRTGNKVVLALAGTTMKHVEVDDFVIHLRSFQGGIEWSGYRGRVSPAYTVLMPKSGAFPAFFKYCLKSRGYIETIASLTDQLRDGQSMRYYDFGKTPLPLPPLTEQREIVKFLDQEAAEIDAFIADQEELIVLLNERRAATITQAVTKGLEQDVPMKESGVEWLGRIPKHWEVSKVSRSFSAAKGRNAAALTKEYCASHPGPYPVYSGQTSNGGVMGKIDTYEFDAGESGVLFSTTVGSAKVMSVSRIFGKFSLSQNCMIISAKHLVDLSFYFYQFQVLFEYEKGNIPQHMQASFRMEDLYGYRYLVIPIDEQNAISQYVDNEINLIDAMVRDAKAAIELSKERREALISAAVTGKIDVRDAMEAKRQLLEGEPVGAA